MASESGQQELVSDEPAVHCGGVLVGIEEVRPHPDNPQVHPPEQVEELAKILRSNGWRQAIVVSKLSGFVIKGHGRLQTAKAMKLKQVPIDYQSYATPEDEIRDLLADNKIAAAGFTDALALGKLLKRLSEKDRKGLGYTQEEIDLYLVAEFVPAAATDRKFVVLETLKMTKEAKAIVLHTIQRYCLKIGKEVDFGEALASICVQWQAHYAPGAVGAPVPEPERPKAAPKPAEPAAAAAAELVSVPEESTHKFEVKFVAKTQLKGKEAVVIRPTKGDSKFYTDRPEVEQAARDSKDREDPYKVVAAVKKVDGDLWIVKLEKA